MVKLNLLNDRGFGDKDQVHNRMMDSTEEMTLAPPPIFDGGVQIPFLSKQKVERSEYSQWRTGKIRMESSEDAPIMDNKGRYFECGRETRNIKFSSRQDRSFDFGMNEAARTFYTKPERMDCPSMNRVLDNLHHVPGETIIDRVKMGKVAGANWSVVERMQAEMSNTAHIGPGHYRIHDFESKFGPLASNRLMFSVVESGRGAEGAKVKKDTVRRRERNLEILRATYPDTYKLPTEPGDDILEAKTTLNTTGVGKFNGGSRWHDPMRKPENYVKTSGLKLDLDYDPHLDRKKLPQSWTTTDQRPPHEVSISANTDYTLDYGTKISMGTKAKSSPIKYSMAFKSKAPVGLQIVPPTSGKNAGPGSFIPADAIEIRDPNKPSSTMLAPRTSIFSNIEPTDGMRQKFKDFSEENQRGPFFPKGSSGLANVQRDKSEKQIKSVYPRLAKSLWPTPKKQPIADPFAYLKPLIK